ncbi:minor tail protein [Gordonia phage Gibbles]|uniref:Minor tail protein n=3 Tax=Gordonia phage Orchid TaxID=1838075 RepID=A0A166YGA1_9CAUD|nr:tail protein [Gordonia phage Orchid]ANA87260.1 minor tail protein [Gordonia phage PatrickStar]ANA87373.1 minor tail protein [Gordonia phage Orchid]ANA87487.1 minor tail protein [Gordonia phage Kampe]QDK01984.1 minor tail protein [Gordonia phage Gibbles]
MSVAPNRFIQDALNAPTSEHVRRIELYEYDGKTPWKQELWDSILVECSVSADYDRDERRNADITLDNWNFELNPEAGNLWYDKVIKLYYGLITHQNQRDPAIMIVEEFNSLGQALALKRLLSAAGIKVVHYNPQVTTLAEVQDFDILISISDTYTRKLSLLTSAFNAGKSILTFGLDATSAQLPYIITGAATSLVSVPGERMMEQNLEVEDEIITGWDSWRTNSPGSIRRILTPAAGSEVIVNHYDDANGFTPGFVMRSDLNGQTWIHGLVNDFETDSFPTTADWQEYSNFLGAVIDRLIYYSVEPEWETQMGEFVIDTLGGSSESRGMVNVTCRDYTKRCLQSKLSKATMFTATQKVSDVIKALAYNAGITKDKVPDMNYTVGKDTTYERDQPRWEIMKTLAQANNLNIFFDSQGYLCLTEQSDPITSPPVLSLEDGPRGNLVNIDRRTSDTSIYNRVTVVGESSDQTKPLVYGEAVNENPDSPTSIGAIGERTNNITNSMVTSNQQAQEIATTLLSVSSLEEFEMNFTASMLPWIEPGEIVELNIQYGIEAEQWGPARFLITSLTFPFDLSPMSGTGKRITKL